MSVKVGDQVLFRPNAKAASIGATVTAVHGPDNGGHERPLVNLELEDGTVFTSIPHEFQAAPDGFRWQY